MENPPLDLSLSSLGPKTKAPIELGIKQGSLKLNDNPFIKGKNVIGCSRANQLAFKGPSIAAASLSSPKLQPKIFHGSGKTE